MFILTNDENFAGPAARLIQAQMRTLLSKVPLLRPREREGPDAQEERWGELLAAAGTAEFYSGKEGEKTLRRAKDPSTFSRIPPIELAEYYDQVQRFRSAKANGSRRVPLHAPWHGQVVVAALTPWFCIEGRVRLILQVSCQALVESRPEALAAPVTVLRRVAAAMAAGTLQLPTLRYGVLAWTGISRPYLTPADRDLFWRMFQVPVFEQFRGFQGELLAAESDCHDGMHIESSAAIWEQRIDGRDELLVTSIGNLRYPALRLATGLRGRLDRSPCPCGRSEPRLHVLGPACLAAAGEGGSAIALA